MTERRYLMRAFTAIELLIVVAIVTVLAMVAVPRLLETQTRAKLARAKSELHKAGRGLEAFHFDHKWYPPDGFWLMGSWGQDPGAMPWVDSNCLPWFAPMTIQQVYSLIQSGGKNFWLLDNCLFLTTPVAYLSPIPKDPFTEADWLKGSFFYSNLYDRWKYDQSTNPSARPYIISAYDGATDIEGRRIPYWILSSSGPDKKSNSMVSGSKTWTQYDPTNGTVSGGDIFVIGP